MPGNIFVHIHSCKEIENFLINLVAIEKAISKRINEYNNRTGKGLIFNENINDLINLISEKFKNTINSQFYSNRFKYEKSKNPTLDDSTIYGNIIKEFDELWSDPEKRLLLVPGKDFLSQLNVYLQENYNISISHHSIINSLNISLIPDEMKQIIEKIENFRKEVVDKL